MPTVKSKTLIGSKTFIDLPKIGLSKIPAKIDTGADSSAIWATNIKETKNGLEFNLFDKSSPNYLDQKVSVKNYRRSIIKNSFGKLERRYKVTLTMELEGRKINAWFTLANRKALSFPVLIGKKTLNHKFLVDVAYTDEKKKNIRLKNVLMIDNRKIGTVVKMVDKISRQSKRQLEITSITYEDVAIKIDHNGAKIFLPQLRKNLEYYDTVYLKTRTKNMEIAATIAKLADLRGMKVIDESLKNYPGISKIHQYVVLSEHGLLIPKTLFLPHSDDVYKTFVAFLGLPFVLKDNLGSKGEANFLIKNHEDYAQAMKIAEENGLKMIAQEFIANEGDFRVLVMGGEVVLVNFRQRVNDETHLNNVSLGATSKELDKSVLPTTVIKETIAAAKLLGLNIAGVDMVKDKVSGVWYCLEVNDSPQIASGAWVDKKRKLLAEYLEKL